MKSSMQWSGFLLAFSTLVFAPALDAQLVVKLSPETLKEFDQYARNVETDLQARWKEQKSFLALNEKPAEKQRKGVAISSQPVNDPNRTDPNERSDMISERRAPGSHGGGGDSAWKPSGRP